MNGHHRRTLARVFEHPPPAGLRWRDVEAMLRALPGAEVSEGRGSRVRVALGGRRATFHRPHPAKEMDRGAVVSLREFLIAAGVEP